MTAKKTISELYDKFYGGKKKSTAQKIKEKLSKKEDKSPSPKECVVMYAEATRNDLMMTVKAHGIKNYRILNKQELTNVLKNIGDQKYINTVVEGAVKRWKSGWGKSKRKQKIQK